MPQLECIKHQDRLSTGGVSTPGAEDVASVLNARRAVGVCNSPLLQPLDKFGSNAGITELFCGLPYFPATDIPVAVRLSVCAMDQSDRHAGWRSRGSPGSAVFTAMAGGTSEARR